MKEYFHIIIATGEDDDILDTMIRVKKMCWMCGKDQDIQRHHVLPKHLGPKRNLVIPLCQKCHQKWHSENSALQSKAEIDKKSMERAVKLDKVIRELEGVIRDG